MKVFWLLVVILVCSGVAFLAFSAAQSQRQQALAMRDQAMAAQERAEAMAVEAKAAAAMKSVPAAEPVVPAPTEKPVPQVAPAANEAKPAVVESKPDSKEEAKPEVPAKEEPAKAEVSEKKEEEPQSQGQAQTGGTVGAKAGGFDVAESRIENQPDGSLLIDGAIKVTGTGTAEDPYVVPWELLVSAEKTYNPSDKLTKIPSSVAMLNGKYVRITGYVAFPMYVQQATELLSMLNQWDGCCIGVPPTPYDAIEVQLKAVVGEEDRMATFGDVQGRFGVKPYVVGDWLVGLYVMEEGELKPKRFNGLGT